LGWKPRAGGDVGQARGNDKRRGRSPQSAELRRAARVRDQQLAEPSARHGRRAFRWCHVQTLSWPMAHGHWAHAATVLSCAQISPAPGQPGPTSIRGPLAGGRDIFASATVPSLPGIIRYSRLGLENVANYRRGATALTQ
jgi:hypothetical protein